MKRKISIITATLNRATLKDCCMSIDCQTYSNWHHYVIGDGLLPFDYFHPQRTTIGFSRPIGAHEPALDKPNGTPNPILRWAIENLDLGEYLCFLDDDNTYEPTFLSKMLSLLENCNKGIALCALNDYRNDAAHDGYPELERCDNSAFLVRAPIAKQVGFPKAYKHYDNIQDFEFIRKCSDNFGWVRTDEKLVNFGITERIDLPFRL